MPNDPTEPVIGIPDIDAQHRDIFAAQQEVASELTSGADPDALTSALDTLASLFEAHLAFEIELMKKAGYAGLAGHEERHASVCASADSILQKIRSEGASPFNLAAFEADVIQVFADHVRNCDQKMAHELSR